MTSRFILALLVAVGGSVGSGGTSLALLWVGADQTFTGLKQAYTEAPQQSYTDQAVTGGAKALGASDETAAYAGRTVETITVVWAGGVAISSSYANASRMGNASTPKAVSTRVAAAETASSENAVVVNSTREVVSERKVVEEAMKKCPCPEGAENVKLSELISRQGPSEMSVGKIRRYTKDMRKNGYGEYPPVEYVSVDGKKIIDNGHHRVEAAKKAGLSEIPAKEVDPTKGTNYLKEAQEAAAEQDSRLR
jgi:hypothetical protein